MDFAAFSAFTIYGAASVKNKITSCFILFGYNEKIVLLKTLLVLVFTFSRTSEVSKKMLPRSSTGNVPILKFTT